MSSGESAGALASAMAAEAYELVPANPRRALTLALKALEAARAEPDAQAAVAALRAAGWAQAVLNDPAAIATFRSGIRAAKRIDDAHGAALLLRLLATQLAWAGESRGAQREMSAAIALLDGLDRARSEVHRLEIHRLSGTTDRGTDRRVRADAARALGVLRRAGDELWEAHLLVNRGLLFSERGELDAAEADLRRAAEVYRRCGAELQAAHALVAIAEVESRRGEVVTCLRLLDEVERSLPLGYVNDYLLLCRANALTQVRLLPEAAAAAKGFLELCSRSGRRDGVATTLLDLAAIAVMSGDPAVGHRLASQALRSFAARGKPVNAALARAACLRARLLEGTLRQSSVRSGLEAAAALELAGWRRESLRTRVLVARVALTLGSPGVARRQLELARPLARTGTVADRVELSHARAILRASAGDRAGAQRRLAEGMKLLDDYRAALGAFELRATASGIGSELSATGLRIAVESGVPSKILRWAERLRGNAMLLPLVRPPSDPELRALQAELRRVGARIREAEDKGMVARGAAGDQARVETAIRSRMRVVDGSGTARSAAPDLRDAATALDQRALVEYVELDGMLGALTLVGRRLAFHDLGPDSSARELEWLRFALARLARTGHGREGVMASADALDRLLVEPLLPAIGERAARDRPDGRIARAAVGGAARAARPPDRGGPVARGVARAPAAAAFSGAQDGARRRPASATRGVGGALARSARWHAHSPDRRGCHRARGTGGIRRRGVAHIACHGRFRADSPLFSSLELADGPLNVYELQGLRRAPELVVLSACDLALSDRQPGDELLGLAAALLGMGTRTIVASVVPIPDAAAKRTMLAFHRNLAGGDAPATALAKAQARAAVPGFVCLGVG